MVFFFFFQAEDGIRDGTVTGVQTCALPISSCSRAECMRAIAPAPETDRPVAAGGAAPAGGGVWTRSRNAGGGRYAPGWSPAASEQRTRAAWARRPLPRAPRRPRPDLD